MMPVMVTSWDVAAPQRRHRRSNALWSESRRHSKCGACPHSVPVTQSAQPLALIGTCVSGELKNENIYIQLDNASARRTITLSHSKNKRPIDKTGVSALTAMHGYVCGICLQYTMFFFSAHNSSTIGCLASWTAAHLALRSFISGWEFYTSFFFALLPL